MHNRIKKSISAKIFLSIAAILIFSCLLIYMVVMIVMPKSYEVKENETISQKVDHLVQNLNTVSWKEADSMIEDFCLKNNTQAILQNGEMEKKYGTSDVPANKHPENTGITQSVITTVTFPDSSVSFTLIVMVSLETVNAISATFYQIFPWIFLLILLISALGAWAVSFLLSKPVLEISSISRQMSALDLTWRCNVKRTDELGVLAFSLNTMAEKLGANMEALEEANARLNEDMIREREHEKQRRVFFAAVSHELKTPVTILRGQLESMIYGIGDYKDTQKYLPGTLDTVDRLEDLVREILMVSRLTANEIKLDFAPLDIRLLLQDCLAFYEPLAVEKGIKIEPGKMEEIVAEVDENYFKKVISNLLSNAVSYSPDGAFIRAELTRTKLTIENTGAHIPEEKLSQIFSPFYRVEQSRNKNTGGSGLGLYIVKTILNLHRMEFSIRNKESGVIFTIHLPQTGRGVPEGI